MESLETTFAGRSVVLSGSIVHQEPEGVRFWTRNKKIGQRWRDGSVTGENAFAITTMG